MKKTILPFLLLLLTWTLSAQTPVQTIYVDFGPDRPADGNMTVSPDANGNYWNNQVEPKVRNAAILELVNSANDETPYILQIVKDFSGNNGIRNGALLNPDKNLLGDLAIATATQDYLYAEQEPSAFKLANLKPYSAYRFYVFGSRKDKNPRTAKFTFYGLTTVSDTQKQGGLTNVGVDQTQNTSDILDSGLLFADSNGDIVVEVSQIDNTFAHINALKMVEYTDVTRPDYLLTQQVYIDLGNHNVTDGNPTTSPDKNGNYWNNQGNTGTSGAALALVNARNKASGFAMKVAKGFQCNGIRNGGLLAPDEKYLGDLAIATATQDYFFVDQTTGELDFTGLDKEKAYKFYVFGSRARTEHWVSQVEFAGKTTHTGLYQSSGRDGGNISFVYSTDLLTPDDNGKIKLTLKNAKNNMAYINCMRLEEYYAKGDYVKASSLAIEGALDISLPGHRLQLTAVPTPANALCPPVVWSVDNPAVAEVSQAGLLTPKANGTVVVTATIQYSTGNPVAASTQAIQISNQFDELYLSGAATEAAAGKTLRLTPVVDMNDNITGVFELYTSLKAGEFKFFLDESGDESKGMIGEGTDDGSLLEGGSAFVSGVTGPVKIVANFPEGKLEVTPIQSFTLVGAAAYGWDYSLGKPLSYDKNGVWIGKVSLSKGDFVFTYNGVEANKISKLTGTTDRLISAALAQANGVSIENFQAGFTGAGDFLFTVDMNNYTYSFRCAETKTEKISLYGSSVAWGVGAEQDKGYGYMYNELLKERNKTSDHDWVISNISIGGNTTLDLKNRWDKHLIPDCAQYVIFGLSLGNEGIHEHGQSRFNQFRDNMKAMIASAKALGKVPVVMNNYTRADYTATDYKYVKDMNLLIHEWDVPSVNTLGAIDDGAGKWVKAYEQDNAHPNTAGHREFFYAMVPSLFDALAEGKTAPKRIKEKYVNLQTGGCGLNAISFEPEGTVHPFAVSYEIKGSSSQVEFKVGDQIGSLSVTNTELLYTSPEGKTVRKTIDLKYDEWHRITLSHFYARGETLVYIDNTLIGSLVEKLVPEEFVLTGNGQCRELFFWRSAINADEIKLLNSGGMLNSSLEIYAPMDADDKGELINHAQSTNRIMTEMVMSIDDLKDNALSVYPNPVSEMLHLNGLAADRTYSYRILAMDGKSVATDALTGTEATVNVARLSSAMYLLELTDKLSDERSCIRFYKN